MCKDTIRQELRSVLTGNPARVTVENSKETVDGRTANQRRIAVRIGRFREFNGEVVENTVTILYKKYNASKMKLPRKNDQLMKNSQTSM
jgi:hypothetical protein